METVPDKLWKEQAAETIQNCQALLINTGAGMGVDSGLPDFRGNEGFWKAYPPYEKLNMSFIDMANPQWFEQDPEMAWGFYGHRLNLYRATEPHEGYHLLLRWTKNIKDNYFIFTSNVDGQFQKAGFDAHKIVECHGSIHNLQCSRPCRPKIWSADKVKLKTDNSTMKAKPPLPVCNKCGSLARPNILMFGDWLWLSDNTEEQQKRFQKWLRQNQEKEIAIIECGAGTAVPTVRWTSEQVASEFKAKLIRINIREPEAPSGHLSINVGALESIKKIADLVEFT